MGQMTIGIMWGAELPKGAWPYDDEAADGGLFEAYTKHAVGPYDDRDWWTRCRRLVPSQCEDRNVVGFWVALDRGGDEYGVEEIGTTPFAEVGQRFGSAIFAATDRWEKFAAWAKEHGVEMPEPSLWLGLTEVA